MTTLIIDVALVVILATAFAIRSERRRRRARSVVHRQARWTVCPLTQRPVMVTFLENAAGQRLSVEECSAFRHPRNVNCEKDCLTQEPNP